MPGCRKVLSLQAGVGSRTSGESVGLTMGRTVGSGLRGPQEDDKADESHRTFAAV